MSRETCPNCGASLSRRARACPECGADERTGWSEKAATDHLGISDPEEFDHAAFVREEFGSPESRGGPRLWVWLVAVLLLAAWLAWRFF